MSMKIGIILASVREARVGHEVAEWMLAQAQKANMKDVEFSIIDLKEFDLPFLGKTPNASQGAAIKAWSDTMASKDGYILVTPEYNHVVPGALQNAFQFLKPEVENKALAFVGYGFLGAARAIVGFRAEVSYQQIAMTQQQINFSLNLDYTGFGTKEGKFTPQSYHEQEATVLLTQLTNWTKALKHLREGKL